MNIQTYLIVISICFLVAILFTCVFSRNIYKEFYTSQLKFDIGFNEMVEGESRLKDFLQNNNINIDGNVVQSVAQKLEIEIGGISDTIKNNAELTIVDNKRIVILKTGLNEQEKLFCLAHECAHLINGDPVPQTRPDGKDKDIIEQKADYLAAAMIMPREKVHKFLLEHGYQNVSANRKVKLIDQMCKEYNATDIVVMRRIREVTELEQRT